MDQVLRVLSNQAETKTSPPKLSKCNMHTIRSGLRPRAITGPPRFAESIEGEAIARRFAMPRDE